MSAVRGLRPSLSRSGSTSTSHRESVSSFNEEQHMTTHGKTASDGALGVVTAYHRRGPAEILTKR